MARKPKPNVWLEGPNERSLQVRKRGRKPAGPHVAQAVVALRGKGSRDKQSRSADGRFLPLPPPARKIDLSERQIAALVGIAPSTVHNILAVVRPRSESSPAPGQTRLARPIECPGCHGRIVLLPCVLCAARGAIS